MELDGNVMIYWLGGVKELPPIKYELVEKQAGPWWWRRVEYEVHSPYGVISEFESKEQALGFIALGSARRPPP